MKVEIEPHLALQEILHSVFQLPDSSEGIAIAFTSANPGDGVTYVSRKIALQISENRSESALYLSSRELDLESWPGGPERPSETGTNLEIVSRNTWQSWHSKVARLRARHRYSIIDCPSVSTASDVLSLAPHIDGIVIVVAANETRKSQVMNVERQIQMVDGKALGYVLNKRRYLVPKWIYKLTK